MPLGRDALLLLALLTVALIVALIIIRREAYALQSHDRWLLAGTFMTVLLSTALLGSKDLDGLVLSLGVTQSRALLGVVGIVAGVMSLLVTRAFRRDRLRSHGPLAAAPWVIAAPGLGLLVAAAFGLGFLGVVALVAVVLVTEKNAAIDAAFDRALKRWKNRL